MTPMNALRAGLVAALLALAMPATAGKGFDYTYFDIGFQHTNGDPEDLNAVRLDGSFDLFSYVALRGSFRRGKFDGYENRDPKYTEFQVGAQGHYPLVKNTLDVVAGANWFYSGINDSGQNGGSSGTQTEGGGVFDAGVRYQAFKALELDAGVRYRTGDFSKTFGTLGAVYKFTKKLSVNLSTDLSDDVQNYFIALRVGL